MSQQKGKSSPNINLPLRLPKSCRDPEQWSKPGGVVFDPVEEGTFLKEDFIASFPNFIFCFIHEFDRDKFPIIHLHGTNQTAINNYQSNGYAVYFSVNGFYRRVDASGHVMSPSRITENIQCVNGHYVDIDCPKEWRDESKTPLSTFHKLLDEFKREQFDALTSPTHPARATLPYIPNLITETRHGLQAVWLFNKPVIFEGADVEKVERFKIRYTDNQRNIISLFGGDKQASDLVRVIRLPFTWHLKNPSNPFPCVPILWRGVGGENNPSFKDFCLALEGQKEQEFYSKISSRSPVQNPSSTPARQNSALQATDERTYLISANTAYRSLSDSEHAQVLEKVNSLYPKYKRPSIQKLISGVPEGERNHTLHVIACAYRQSNVTEDMAFSDLRGYSGLRDSEVRCVIRSAYKRPVEYGWNHPTVAAVVTEDERMMFRTYYAEAAHALFGRRDKNLGRISSNVPVPKEMLSEDPLVSGSKRSDTDSSLQTEEDKQDDQAGQDKQDTSLDEGIMSRVAKKTRLSQLSVYHHRMEKLVPQVRYLGSLGPHYKEGNIYRPIPNHEELRHIVTRSLEEDGFVDFISRSTVDNVILKWMAMPSVNIPDAKIEPVPMEKDLDFLPVQNGILELATRNLRPFPEDEAWLSISRAAYDPSAKCPLFKNFIHQITKGDKEKASILQEIAGYCLSSSTKFQKAFIFLGSGSNGKGVFIGTIEQLLGDGLCSSLKLDDLEGRFAAVELERKRLNIIDEVSDNYFRSEKFKQLVGGTPITTDVKYSRYRKFRMTAKLVFTVNTLPRIDANDFALYRRLLIMRFTETFSGDAVDKELSSKLSNELSGILNWCLEGYERLTKNNNFTVHKESSKMVEEMNEVNSLLVRFLLSKNCILSSKSNITVCSENIDTLYEAYSKYAYSMGGRPKQVSTFQQELGSLTHSKLSHIKMFSPSPSTDGRAHGHAAAIVEGVMLRRLVS